MSDTTNDFAIFTQGSGYNIKCPFCGKNNSYVCYGIEVKHGHFIEFIRQCFFCGKDVYYRGQREIMLIAEKQAFSGNSLPRYEPVQLKVFWLLFEDTLKIGQPATTSYRPRRCPVLASCEHEVILRFGLVRRTTAPTDKYWDGKCGEVTISILSDQDKLLVSFGDVQVLVRKLFAEYD